MTDLDFDRARKSLEELAADFRRGAELYSDLRHSLVEAPAERTPEYAELQPVSSDLDATFRRDVRTFLHPRRAAASPRQNGSVPAPMIPPDLNSRT